MELAAAQAEMRRSYVGGGPGVVVSGLVWLAAGITQLQSTTQLAFVVLFLGGMVIFPAATGLVRGVFRRPAPGSDNRLGQVALESTIAMIGGFFPAYLMLTREPALVFPLAAIAVGTHYFAFGTVYGRKSFWMLGGVITALGLVEAVAPGHLIGGVVLAVAATELVAGGFISVRNVRSSDSFPVRADF